MLVNVHLHVSSNASESINLRGDEVFFEPLVREDLAIPGLAEETVDRRCLRVRGYEALAGRYYWRRESCSCARELPRMRCRSRLDTSLVANGIGIRSHGPSAHDLEVTFDFTVEGSKGMRLAFVAQSPTPALGFKGDEGFFSQTVFSPLASKFVRPVRGA
jgi:hypothetical protein